MLAPGFMLEIHIRPLITDAKQEFSRLDPVIKVTTTTRKPQGYYLKFNTNVNKSHNSIVEIDEQANKLACPGQNIEVHKMTTTNNLIHSLT